jgi:cytochrome c biogenesis protein CcmG/thiol:disulfide interchange protein DsbE
MKKFTFILIPLILGFFVCARAEKLDMPGRDYPPAPDFTFKDLRGNEISLSDCRDKVVFLNFWATWCPPCREEIPGFIEVNEKYKNRGLVIIGISVDRISPKSVLNFVKKHKITYPVVMSTKKIIKDYTPGNVIPVTIIIDRRGKIRHKLIGYRDKEILENIFLKLMEEK